MINAAIALIEASGMLKARRVGKAVVFSVADEYRGLIGTCRDQASRRAIGKGSER